MRAAGSRLAIDLGPAAIARLIPHRAPLALVDKVTGYLSTGPALWAQRSISPKEPVLIGHFPGHAIWPGAYTIEGLAQCGALALALSRRERASTTSEAFVAGLAGLDASPAPERVEPDRQAAGLLASVDIKLLQPVGAGARLDYEVEVTHAVGELIRLRALATVAGREVARGTLTVARLPER